MDALPAAARSTVVAEAKQHPIRNLVQEEVASDGALLGKYTKFDEPSGDGP
jgi:hypothetical protein